jgi:poly(A) polymerase
MIKLLQTGHALASIEQMRRHGLDRGVFPILDAVLQPEQPHPRAKFVELALADTDRRVGEGRAVAPSFLLACMLWHDVQLRWRQLCDAASHRSRRCSRPSMRCSTPASATSPAAASWRPTCARSGRCSRASSAVRPAAASLVAQPRFRAGYDFLRLRADVGEVDTALADWWEDFHLGSEDEREALLESCARSAPCAVAAHRDVQRPRGRWEGATVSGDDAAEAAADEGSEAPADAPGAQAPPAPAQARGRRGLGAPPSGGGSAEP